MRTTPMFVALAFVAASCSSATEQGAPDALAAAESTLPAAPDRVVATTEPLATATTAPVTEFDPAEGFPAWYGAPDTTAPPTTAAPTTAAPAKAAAPAAPNNGGGGTPAVTSGGGSPQAPSALYQGVLGTYTLDQVFATSPVAAPPTPAGLAPLTGLPGGSQRPAVAVKVDNSSKARPQSGLNMADIVFEEEVEYGITRLAAIYHTNDATVGPVRSGRSTDISFLNALGTPALAYSGANSVIDRLLLNQVNISNYSAARSSGYWRSKSRRAPSNLYTKTSSFSSVAPGGPPRAQFHYRAPGVASTQGVNRTDFKINYPSNKVRWDWNGASWVRSQGGGAHTTDGQAVTAANVVVVSVPAVGTGLFDSTGAPVPEFVFVGEGSAVVYTDGRRVDGAWTRPTLRDPAILHVNGQAITLTPGRTWVQITSNGQFEGN